MEDNRADVFLIRESLRHAGIDAAIHVVPDGDRAIKLFQEADQDPAAICPNIVILDINLPKKAGGEVLSRMRQTVRCAAALVVVVTSSDNERDREEMEKLGVKGYFRKPSAYDEFMKLGPLIKDLLGETIAD